MLQEESEQSWNQDGSTGDMLTAFEGFPSWVLRTLRSVSPLVLYILV